MMQLHVYGVCLVSLHHGVPEISAFISLCVQLCHTVQFAPVAISGYEVYKALSESASDCMQWELCSSQYRHCYCSAERFILPLLHIA